VLRRRAALIIRCKPLPFGAACSDGKVLPDPCPFVFKPTVLGRIRENRFTVTVFLTILLGQNASGRHILSDKSSFCRDRNFSTLDTRVKYRTRSGSAVCYS